MLTISSCGQEIESVSIISALASWSEVLQTSEVKHLLKAEDFGFGVVHSSVLNIYIYIHVYIRWAQQSQVFAARATYAALVVAIRPADYNCAEFKPGGRADRGTGGGAGREKWSGSPMIHVVIVKPVRKIAQM